MGNNKILSENRKSRHEYFLGDEIEAGIVLHGWEVKAMKRGNFSITEAYITFRHGECFLSGCNVHPENQVAFSGSELEKARDKKLLLKRNQITKLRSKVDRDGITVIPLYISNNNGLLKVFIAEARGKKLHDKRKITANRQWNIQKQRLLKHS